MFVTVVCFPLPFVVEVAEKKEDLQPNLIHFMNPELLGINSTSSRLRIKL